MRSKFLLLCVVYLTICLAPTAYAYSIPDTSRHKVSDSSLNAFSTDSTDDILSVSAIYIDSNRLVKGILLHCVGDYNDISVNIGGTEHTITSTAESGYIYEYPSEDIAYTSGCAITLTADKTTSNQTSADIIPIVSADEDWIVDEDDKHCLTLYTGDSKDIVVPNLYQGEIITAIGGHWDEDNGYYNNIVGDSEESYTSLKISDGIKEIADYAFGWINGLDGTSIYIPQTVTKIGDYAFSVTNFTGELILPEGLEHLGRNAFIYCNKLTGDLTIPSGIKKIPYAVFFGCSSMDGTLTLSEGVEEIGELAFGSGSESTAESFSAIELPSTLKKIGPYALQYCTKVKQLNLPEGLETISDGAFDHMSGLECTTFVIPSTVTTIGGDYNVSENTGYGDHVFYDMGKNDTFTAFEVAEGNKYFTAVDGVLYNSDITRLVGYPRGKRDSEYAIPEGVTQLDDLSFSRTCYLTKLVLPDSYTITTEAPANTLNKDGNSLSTALYIYTAVAEIAVKDSNPNYTTIDGILYSKDKKTLWYVPNRYNGTIEVADGTEKMEKGCIYASSRTSTGWSSLSVSASVNNIDETTLETINDKNVFMNHITAEGNQKYIVANGILKEVALGDVNADGNIDNTDTALLLKYISGQGISGNFYLYAGDVNSDNIVDLTDVIKLITLEETT